MSSLLDSEYTLKAFYTRHSAHQYSTSYHTNYLLLLLMLSLAKLHCLFSRALLPLACKSLSSPHPAPSERLVSSTFARWHVCHLCHSSTVRPLVDGVVLRLFDAKPTEKTGCVSHRILRLYARWRSPRQETILRRSDFMLSLTRAWSSSLHVGRLSNDTPRPRTKSWRW
jgi:hypothetical protein